MFQNVVRMGRLIRMAGSKGASTNEILRGLQLAYCRIAPNPSGGIDLAVQLSRFNSLLMPFKSPPLPLNRFDQRFRVIPIQSS
jgi:hypothetical protein